MRAFCLSQQGVPSWNHLSLQFSSLSVYLYCKIQRGLLCPFRNPHLMFIYVISLHFQSCLPSHHYLRVHVHYVFSYAILPYTLTIIPIMLDFVMCFDNRNKPQPDSGGTAWLHSGYNCPSEVDRLFPKRHYEFLFDCCSKHCSPSDALSYGWPICQWTIYAKLL